MSPHSSGRLILLGILLFLLFITYQAHGIPAGDSGDLVTAAYLGGVPHPPGYPLYTLLGWIVSKFPFATVSFRIGLLSSLPHALVGVVVYALTLRLTRSMTSAFFAVLVIIGNYLFFLYSVTPEVFALFDLLSILLFFLLFRFKESQSTRFFFLACFVFGLSLSHHHVALFFIPSIAYFLWSERSLFHRWIKRNGKTRLVTFVLLCLFIGVLPYLYVPIAARSKTIVNWNRAVDLPSFVRLVTRADYGTFQSGSTYGQLLSERLFQIKTWVNFVFLDVTLVGIILALLGGFWLYKRSRSFFLTLILALLFVGPIFFFYASFPLVNKFMLGTYERFLLPSYTLIAVFIGCGLSQVLDFVRNLSRTLALNKLRSVFIRGVIVLLFLYPTITLFVTLSRFAGYDEDMTAQNVGFDVLRSAPKQAIILLSRDTTLFTTQYVRYVLNERPDTIVLQANSLGAPDYQRVVADVFPFVRIPKTTGSQFFLDFVRDNSEKYPILTNSTLMPVPIGWVSVPVGLLSLITPAELAPEVSDLRAMNSKLWQNYQDPTVGILARHNHLMLSDVRDVYVSSRMRYGTVLLKAGEYKAAREEFREAVRLGGDIQIADAYTSLGLTELWLDDCNAALTAFSQARETTRIQNKELVFYEAITYRDCLGDEPRAKELFQQYEQMVGREQIPLESL